MDNKLTKKYGLFTAICLVVGTVIGSGVFFKAEKILIATEGNMWLSILSWAIGGAVMIICSYVFSTLSSRTEVKANGVVDYAEDALGEKYGYFVGWFLLPPIILLLRSSLPGLRRDTAACFSDGA